MVIICEGLAIPKDDEYELQLDQQPHDPRFDSEQCQSEHAHNITTVETNVSSSLQTEDEDCDDSEDDEEDEEGEGRGVVSMSPSWT